MHRLRRPIDFAEQTRRAFRSVTEYVQNTTFDANSNQIDNTHNAIIEEQLSDFSEIDKTFGVTTVTDLDEFKGVSLLKDDSRSFGSSSKLGERFKKPPFNRLLAKGNPDDAYLYFKSQPVPPSQKMTTVMLMKLVASHSAYQGEASVLVLKRGLKIPWQIVAPAIRTLVAANNYDSAFEIYKIMNFKETSYIAVGTLLGTRAIDAEQLELSFSILHRLVLARHSPLTLFKRIAIMYVKLNRQQELLDFLTDHIPNNLTFYQQSMEYLVRLQPDLVSSDAFRRLNILPIVQKMKTMNIDDGLSLLYSYCARCNEKNRMTVTSFMIHHLFNAESDKLQDYVAYLRAHDFMSLSVYIALIHISQQKGDFETCIVLHNELIGSGIICTLEYKIGHIRLLLREGKLDMALLEAKKIEYNRLARRRDNGNSFLGDTYRHLVIYYCKNDMEQEALNVIEKIKKERLTPTASLLALSRYYKKKSLGNNSEYWMKKADALHLSDFKKRPIHRGFSIPLNALNPESEYEAPV